MAISPYFLGGGLSFGGIPKMGDYESAYANALALNQQSYQNILSGYQSLAAQQAAAQQPILSGFNALTDAVLGDLTGVEKSQQQEIADSYAKQAGSANQSMISRGLSNTTVRDSVQRGLQLDKTKANTDLANKVANLRASYRSNLSSQALGYADKASQQRLGLGMKQLDWMNTVNAPFPNASEYMRLAMMKGAMQAGRGGLGGAGMGQSPPPSSDKPFQSWGQPIPYNMGRISGGVYGGGGGGYGNSWGAQALKTGNGMPESISPYSDYQGGGQYQGQLPDIGYGLDSLGTGNAMQGPPAQSYGGDPGGDYFGENDNLGNYDQGQSYDLSGYNPSQDYNWGNYDLSGSQYTDEMYDPAAMYGGDYGGGDWGGGLDSGDW